MSRYVEPSPCADCGKDTTPCLRRRGCRHGRQWEWYMVWPALWELAWRNSPARTADQFGVSNGFLCIGCLQQRIGRLLTAADFTRARVNDPQHPWNTEQLAAALQRRPLQRPAAPGRVFLRRTPHNAP